MVMTVVYAAPALISAGLGLPLLLSPPRLLALCGAAYAGGAALALEPAELDVLQQPYTHLFRGIPSEAAVRRRRRPPSPACACMQLFYADYFSRAAVQRIESQQEPILNFKSACSSAMTVRM